MLGGSNSSLLEIEELLRHMKVDEVTTRLADFRKQDNVTKEESHRAELLWIKLLFDTYKWREGLDSLDKILLECEKEENKLTWLDALFLKTISYTEFGLYDEGIKNSEEGLEFIKKRKTSDNVFILRKGWFLLYKGMNHNFKGNLNIAEEIVEQCLELARKLNDTYLLYSSYKFKTEILFNNGNFQQNFELYLKMYELAKEMKNDFLVAKACSDGAVFAQWVNRYDLVQKFIDEAEEITKKQKKWITTYEWLESNKAYIYMGQGKMSKAISTWEKILPKLRKKAVNPIEIGSILEAESLIESFEGRHDRAVELRQQAVAMFTKIGNRFKIWQYKALLARCLLTAGKYDQALSICQENIEDHNEFTNELLQLVNFLVMGKIYQIRGEYYLSFDYYTRSISAGKKFPGYRYTVILCIFPLIQLLAEKNQEEMSYKYLGELEEIVNKFPSKLHNKYHQAAKAIILKASSRPKNWMQALIILEEVVEEIWEGEIIDVELIIIALINLCELLMNEFSMSGEKEVIEELEKHTKKLEEIANKQKSLSYILRLEVKNIKLHTIWLKTIYSLADVDLNKAKELIEEARDMADEEGLVQLAEKINQQQSKLYNQLLQWNEFIQKQDII